MRRVTIRDVAREAGVSVTAASRALNGRAEMAAHNRQRVLDVARRLHYVPSSAARTLVLGRSRTLGVIVHDNASPVYAQVLRGVEETATANGFGLLFANSANSQAQALRSLEMLIGKHVDGVLLTPVQTDRQDIEVLRRAGTPFVLMLRHFDDLPTDYVVTDNVQAGYLATQHLVDTGHRRIGHLGGPVHASTARGRRDGFRSALAEAGLRAGPEVAAEFTVEGAHAAALEMLRGPQRPGAVFAATDLQAVGLLKAARELGLAVPADLAVVGGDDIELAAFLEPALTTFHQRGEEIGGAAARILLDRLAGDQGPPRQVVMKPRLVVRRSCGCPPP